MRSNREQGQTQALASAVVDDKQYGHPDGHDRQRRKLLLELVASFAPQRIFLVALAVLFTMLLAQLPPLSVRQRRRVAVGGYGRCRCLLLGASALTQGTPGCVLLLVLLSNLTPLGT